MKNMRPLLNQIFKDVKTATGLDIAKQSSKQSYVTARYIYMDLAYKFTNCTFELISGLVNKDHSTVVYGLDNLESRLFYEKDMKSIYADLLEEYDKKHHRVKREVREVRVKNEFRKRNKLIRKINKMNTKSLMQLESFIESSLT